MADESIANLPFTATTVVAGDFGVVVHGGNTSKITQQNLINSLVGFITANANIGGGKITLLTTGAATFANGAISFLANGTAGFASGDFQITAGGGVTFASGNASVDASGNFIVNSLGLESGGFAVNASGAVTAVGGQAASGSLGTPVIVGTVLVTNSGTSSGPVTIFTTQPLGGLYRLSGYLEIYNADVVPGTIDVTLGYTDLNGPQSNDLSGTQPTNATGSFTCGNNVFSAVGVSSITYTITATGGSGGAQCQLTLVLERLQ